MDRLDPEAAFRRALLRALAMPLALLAVTTGVLLWQVWDLQQAAGLVDHSDRVIGQTRKVRRILFDGAARQRGYLLTGGPGYRAGYQRKHVEGAEAQTALERIVAGKPQQAASARELRRLQRLWHVEAAAEMAARDARGRAVDGEAAAALRRGDALLDAIHDSFEEFLAAEEAVRYDRAASAERAGHLTVGAVVVLMVLLGGVLVTVTRAQMRSLVGTYGTALARAQEGEERYATTLSCIGDAVIATDAQARITFMNPVAEQLTGWTAKEAFGKPAAEVFQIVSEGTRTPVASPIERVLREGIVVGLANHTVLVGKDGRETAIDDSGAPIRDNRDRLTGAVLVFRDITERRKAEEARGHLAAIVESASDAIIAKSLDGIVLAWNAGAERLYGYAAREMVGQPISRLIPPDMPNELPAILNQLRRGERVEQFETQRLRKDGARIDVSLAISPVRNRHGEVVSAATIARDITERKRQETQIVGLNRRLQRMIGEAHHRVRNSLQLVAAMVDLQQMEHEGSMIPPQEMRRLSAHVHTLGIIHDLLMQDADEQGQANTVSVKALLERLVPGIGENAPGCTLTLRADDVRLATRRATALALVVTELVSNATHFGGCNITIVFRAVGDEGILEVLDDGRGLPEEFDPVRSAHTGLTFVESLVRYDLNALTEYANRADGGARIVVKLPLDTVTEEAAVWPSGPLPEERLKPPSA